MALGIFPSLPSGMDLILKKHFDSFMKKGELPPELKEFNGSVKLFDNVELLVNFFLAQHGCFFFK